MRLVKLDLMDEKGLLTNVFENVSFKDYASTILKGRKKYFLIRILPQDDEGEIVNYQSFLQVLQLCLLNQSFSTLRKV